MTARRRDDWPERLAAYIHRCRSASFAWGCQDCALFAAGAVLEQTGVDPAGALRGYQNARSGYRTLRAQGHRTLVAAVDAALTRHSAPGFAGRGDVVAIQQSSRWALGVCIGRHLAFPGAHGLVFLPLYTARIAWKV